MVVTVFRSRLDPAHAAEYERLGQELYEIGSSVPGFVSIKDFVADDGERVAIVEFESEEALEAWRNHPRHREVQTLGRERLYLEYSVQSCHLVRESRFRRPSS